MSKEETLINNEAQDNKFWVIVGTKMLLYTDKKEATLKMQEVLAKAPESSLAQVSWDKDKSSFEVDPVPWKEISQLSSVGLADAQKEIERLKAELAKKSD